MASHTDLRTVGMNKALLKLSLELQEQNEQVLEQNEKMREQHEKDEQEKRALAARVEQLEQNRSRTQNAQDRVNQVSDNLQLNGRLQRSLAAEPGQEPNPRNKEPEQRSIRADKFIPYPAPMGDIEKSLKKLPEFRTTGSGKALSLWEAEAALKYIMAGDIKKPKFASVAKSLQENENANLDAGQQRSDTAIINFWKTRFRRMTRCGKLCNIKPIEPADQHPGYVGTRNRLRSLEKFYANKLSRSEQKSYFERGDIEDPRPHGDAVEDAKIVAEHGQQGGASFIEELTVYQYAYQEAHAMKPHLLLELDFPALERLLSERATMAFNPLITWAQCESTFRSIDQHVTNWHRKISSAIWSNLSKYERSREKTKYAKKLEDFKFLEKSGCKLWFHQFPIDNLDEFVTGEPTRRARPTRPTRQARLGRELTTMPQQDALTRARMAAENDRDSIKEEEIDTDNKEYLSGSGQQKIVEKEGVKEDVDPQSSCREDKAKVSLTEAHCGSIAAGSTSRNHATGAAKSERIHHDPNQDDDGSTEKSAIRNTKLSPKDAEEWRSTGHVESATELEDDAADDSEIPTDVEITEKEGDNKIRRRRGLDRRYFNNLYDSDASVSRSLRSMNVSNSHRDLNEGKLSKPPAFRRIVSSSPRGTSRSQAKRKGGISSGSSPNAKKSRMSSLRREVRREARIGDLESESGEE